ncbi:MAG: hypothetical protein V9G19_07770 [Tetrasphaera sp.]
MARMRSLIAALGWYAAPLAVAVVLALLVLGPALGPGVVLAYDLGWSPDPRLTPFVTGTGSVAPRAVPSDAVGVVLGRVVGAGAAQTIVLLAVVILAGLGPVALLRRLRPQVGVLGRCAAATVGIWNPFVAERLAIGQWTIVLGYGLSALGLRAVLGWRAGTTRLTVVCGCIGAAALGGANTLLMVVGPVVLLTIWPARWTPGPAPLARLRAGLSIVAVTLGLAAVWALPAIAADVRGDPVGGRAFAARPDTPFGLVVSLLSGGGMWNQASHPAPRAALLPAAAATALVMMVVAIAARVVRLDARGRGATIAVAASGVLGLCAVAVSGLEPLAAGWARGLDLLPGGALLRDSQKLLAGWVLVLALASGLAVERLWRRPGQDPTRVLAVVLALLPLAVLPTLAWGVGGRWRPVDVPGDFRAAAAELSTRPPGLVAVLPWLQYRRYPWNDDRVALTVAPRIVDQPVLVSDDLLTWAGWVRGEDGRAALVREAIDAGEDPVTAVRRAGARYVFIELDSAVPLPSTSEGTIVHRSATVLVVDLGEVRVRPPAGPARWPIRVGWAVSLFTEASVLAGLGFHRRFSGQLRVNPLLPFGT